MIYTTGTIAVSGKTVTGTGTEFNAALSLIRVGCTLIAISNPVQIFSITEVKSATSLSVTPSASPAIPAGTKFSILLSDSISVDGLAQDVAETLRYYQGKESEIADAVEFFSDNKDVISASKLASQSATTATNAATTATSAADSAKTYRDEAREYANQTAQPYAYVLQPLPDVWIPFNDSLDMITGYGPGTKKVTIDGEEKTISSDKVVSFSRASTATYINKSGVLTTADINEPRFEKEGLLIEGTRTNFLINGSAPASWGHSTNLTVTAETDSYGFLYGKFVADDSTIGGTGACDIASVIGANTINTTQHDEQYVTASCRFRSSSDVRLRIRFAGGEDTSSLVFLCNAYIKLSDMSVEKTGTDADNITVSVTTDSITGWNRAVVTYKSTVTLVTAQIQFAPVRAFVSGDYMEVATPQVELGTNASSYISSGATPSTRASDLVSVTTKNNLARPPFSFLLEIHKDWFRSPNAAPRIFDIANANTGQSVIAAVNRGSDQYYMSLSTRAGNYINAAAGVKLTDNATIGAVVKSDGTFHVIMNGTPGGDSTCIYGGVTQDKNIRFGGQTSDGTRHIFGHIRNFRIWHKALTDSQLSEIV
ncbi:TPA: phage tail protein [Escherichia coli]|nr:phage tail protein [Escherichia coli]